MADTLTTISNFITSPPGRLVAGAVLAGIVWKFFEKVEEKLNDNTKLEIALWLLSVKATGKLDPLPDTFAKVFDQVFGNKPLSWTCFWRSVAVSMVTSVLALMLVVRPTEWGHGPTLRVLAFILFANILPDYVSLLETRAVLGALKRRGVLVSILLLVLDLCATVIIMEQGIVLALNVMITHFRRPLAQSWYVLLHPAFALQFVNESHLWFPYLPSILHIRLALALRWIRLRAQTRPPLRRRLRLVQSPLRHRAQTTLSYRPSRRLHRGIDLVGRGDCENDRL